MNEIIRMGEELEIKKDELEEYSEVIGQLKAQ